MRVLAEIGDTILGVDCFLDVGNGQRLFLLKCLCDGLDDDVFQLASLPPALIPELHLELQLAEDSHEGAIALLIEAIPHAVE